MRTRKSIPHGTGRAAESVVKTAVAALATACLLIGACNRYNPFTDFDNAGIAIGAQSFQDGDTVAIFAAESLSVLFTAWEILDSVTIQAPANRLWHDQDTVLAGERLGESPFIVRTSFYDTGLHRIEITSFAQNGDSQSHSLTVYAQQPLHQQPIVALIGDSATLRTTPVHDRDVTYYWAFGVGEQFLSPVCSARVVVRTPLFGGTGRLWVSDGRYASPAAPFSFALQDTTGPQIACVNEGFLGADTILTADTLFDFRVRIVDQLDGWVDSASIQGEAFDHSVNHVYHKLFERMDRYPPSAPLRVTVYALDHFVHGNEQHRHFWLAFADTAAISQPLAIRLGAPSRDTTITSISPYHVFGTTAAFARENLVVRMTVEINGNESDNTIVLDSGSGQFSWNLLLEPGQNDCIIRAVDIATDAVLDSVCRTLFYNAGFQDTIAPLIVTFLADGKEAAGLYTAKERITVGAQVFDEGAGVDSVEINGAGVPASAETPTWYYDTVTLEHVPGGNELFLVARDREGNQTTRTAVVFRNRLPFVQSTPQPAFIFTDSLYTDTIEAFDPDGDSIVIEKVSGPENLSVTNRGVVSWLPALADTGKHSVTIRLWDGYQPVHKSFMMYVTPNGQTPPGVISLATTLRDFPPFLEVGRDSLELSLAIEPNTGIPPFRFFARIVDTKTRLLTGSTENTVRWRPSIADTGYRQLIIVAEDAFPNRDTLYPMIRVTPPNRPCSLAVSFKADTLPNGALDLNGRQTPDTLRYRILDPDEPEVDRYTVTLYQSRVKTISVIDSAIIDTFSLILDPTAMSGYDTAVAIVIDDRMRADTLRQAVNYGLPPEAPVCSSPSEDTVMQYDQITLQWTCTDPDGDLLWYDVYLGPVHGDFVRVGSTTQSSFALETLEPGFWRWRVVARDWKSSTTGDWCSFEAR